MTKQERIKKAIAYLESIGCTVDTSNQGCTLVVVWPNGVYEDITYFVLMRDYCK